MWCFLYSHGEQLRTRRLTALSLIRMGTWRLLVSACSKKSYSPTNFAMIIENMENGTVIDFAHHFLTFPHQKGTDRPCDSAEMRLHWLSRNFGYTTGWSVIKLRSLLDQFKVFMIMCNMKVADIEMMMNQLEISTATQGFLEAEADASVIFERLQVLHR